MIRLARWLVYRLGPMTLLLLLSLLAALGSVAAGLADSVRGLEAGLLVPVAVVALLVGWGLAKSPLPGWLAALVAFGLGVEAIFLRIGRFGALILMLGQRLSWLTWGIWRWRWDGPPDLQPLLLVVGALASNILTLLSHLYNWGLALAGGESPSDLVAVAIVWSLALWMVGAWAGWWVRRRSHPLQALTPAGVLLGATLFYRWGKAAYLLPVLGTALLLMVLTSQSARQRRWEAAGVDFPSDVEQEVALIGAGLALVLVMLGMIVPSVSWQQVSQWAARLVGERPASELRPVAGHLPQPGANVSGPGAVFGDASLRGPGLPRQHLLGSGPELSERVVMLIYPQGQNRLSDGTNTASLGESEPGYYWRSLTYDRYTGRGWVTGSTDTLTYQAGQPAWSLPPTSVSSVAQFTRIVRQSVQVVGDPDGLLYTAGPLLTANYDYSVAWRLRPGEGDLYGGDPFGATIEGTEGGESYQVDASVLRVGEAQLRAAGDDYPEWIRTRYLALPDEVPARVLALARDLTATQPTPYDRALAIQAYLRGYPYSLDLPQPPGDHDIVDYFLFDLQQGYCDYYATAMAVLARAAGLPARLVIGYATGTYDVANERYVVTEADAHSWVELYFPKLGWVEFEPTAARALIGRPADVPPASPSELAAPEPMITAHASLVGWWWLVFPGVISMLGLGVVIWGAIDGWRLRRLSPRVAVTVLYARLYRQGSRLTAMAQPGHTPYEFTASLAAYLAARTEGKRRAAGLTPATQEARWLADLYVRSCYARHSPDATELSRAVRLWRRLRHRLWLASAGDLVARLGPRRDNSNRWIG
jgi:transglutaminase-like putative cysteine protease